MKVLDSKRVYEGQDWSLRLDTIQSGDGPVVQREVVEYPQSVIIVPVTGRSTVLMVRQFRYANGETLLELPAGKVDPADVDPETAAQRELREEAGYRAGRMFRMGGQWPAPGYSTEWMHVFLATELSRDPLPGDVDEEMAVEEHPLERVPGMIRSGEIRDTMSIAALMMATALFPEQLPNGAALAG